MSTNGIETRTMSARELQRLARVEKSTAKRKGYNAARDYLAEGLAADRARMTPEEQVLQKREQDERTQQALRLVTLNGKPVKPKGKRKARGEDDAGLTDAFVEAHGEHFRYVAAWGKWYHWTGQVWQEERTQLVRDMAKGFCQSRGRGRAKTIGAVHSLASATRTIAARIEQWDADPWLLNTPGGIVDLRTGTMHPHDPGAHMTKITSVFSDTA
jgi:D5 N terminal like